MSPAASCFCWLCSWLKHTCSKFSWLDLICKGTSMSFWSYDDGSLNIELQNSIETSNKFCRAASIVASICAWRKFGVGCPLGRKGLGHAGDQEPDESHSSVSSSLWDIRIRLFLREKKKCVICFGIVCRMIECGSSKYFLDTLHPIKTSKYIFHFNAFPMDVTHWGSRCIWASCAFLWMLCYWNHAISPNTLISFFPKKNRILKTKCKTTVRHFSSQPPGVFFYWRTIYERHFITLETVKKVNGLTKPQTFSTKANFNKMLS